MKKSILTFFTFFIISTCPTLFISCQSGNSKSENHEGATTSQTLSKEFIRELFNVPDKIEIVEKKSKDPERIKYRWITKSDGVPKNIEHSVTINFVPEKRTESKEELNRLWESGLKYAKSKDYLIKTVPKVGERADWIQNVGLRVQAKGRQINIGLYTPKLVGEKGKSVGDIWSVDFKIEKASKIAKVVIEQL